MGTQPSARSLDVGDERPRWWLASLTRVGTSLSLGTYLGAIVGLVAILAVAALVTVRERAYDDARTTALESQKFAATQAAADVSSSLTALSSAVAATAATPGLTKVFVDAKGCGLNFTGAGGFKVGRLEIVRADGTVACSSRPISAASTYRGAPLAASDAGRRGGDRTAEGPGE